MNHKDFLFHLLDILEKNKIPYYLMCGTLLGAVRENNFLASDDKDTDIAVDDAYYWQVRDILNQEITEHSIIYYNYIWRKEICIVSTNRMYKLDIFFMEKQDDKYYIYSYKPSPKDGKWNWEWRAEFSYDLFYPLQTVTFMDRVVSVPNEYEKVLELHYGLDWKTPHPDFVTGSVQKKDDFYEGFYPAGISGNEYHIESRDFKIGFICVNFLRNEETKICVNSLQQFYTDAKIYIADQNAPSGDMIHFYETHNIEYYYVPFDCGLSYCRNLLIDKVKEPYLMWGDNDFLFTEHHGLDNAITILNNYKNIGFVGGSVFKNNKMEHYERLLSYMPDYGVLIYTPLEVTQPEKHIIGNIDFYYCDMTFNYVICRTTILHLNKKLRWNENLKVRYEHSDAFLRIKMFSDYRVVYCPSMQVVHNHLPTSPEYHQLRYRDIDKKAFAKDWKLIMNFTVGKGQEIY